MNLTTQMMEMHRDELAMPGMNLSMMQDCIEACSACEQACTMCTTTMLGDDMAACLNRCMNTADVCNATMRMLMRTGGMHRESMMAMLEAAVTMCDACADECENHASMREECRMCAEVCRQCAMSCEKMLGMMSEMAMG